MSRFEVVTCDGWLNEKSARGSGKSDGRSYVVLDTLWNYRKIVEYRSESYRYAPGYWGAPSKAETFRLAREAAKEHAARLNDDPTFVPALPEVAAKHAAQRRVRQADYSFRPTCPRCSIVCPAGSRYCAECGTFLFMTDDELAELRREVV